MAAILELIEPFVGHADQNFLKIAVVGINGQSIVESEWNLHMKGFNRCRVSSTQTTAQGGCLFRVRLWQQKREFVPTQTKGVVRCTHGFSQRFRHQSQCEVPLRVSIPIVYSLELSQIENDKGEAVRISDGAVQFFFEVVVEETPVIKAG